MSRSLTSVSASLLLLVLGGAVVGVVNAHDTLTVHGSGTTNPSKCYWLIMDQIMDRAKWPIRLDYRAVGSSTGQKEFIGASTSGLPDNDFGSGDIPIPTDDYNALTQAGVEFVHLPIVLGAISLFHSVPNISTEPGQGLNLTACVISRIFKREITTWDHEDVVAMNPNLDLPSEQYPITVARRVLGSSSTASVTKYLHQTCPQEWPEDLVGSTIEWPDDTKPCEGSGGMTECIRSTEGTIGYIDAGHGHEEGLNEIELQNADGTYISSKESNDKGGIAAAAGPVVPERADMDFGNVNLLNQPGEFTWPIVAMSYVYVRKDLSHIPDPQEQTLLKAFLTALYDPDYINQCVERFAFTTVPENVRQIGLAGIDMLVTADNATDWTFESSTLPNEGQGDYVISVKRRTYAEYQRSSLEGDVSHLHSEITSLKDQLKEARESVTNMSDEVQSIRQQVETGGGPFATTASEYATYTQDDAGQLTAALIMSSISIVLWALTLIVVGFKRFHRPNKDALSSNGVADGSGHGGGRSNSAHGASSAAAHSAAVTMGNEHVT